MKKAFLFLTILFCCNIAFAAGYERDINGATLKLTIDYDALAQECKQKDSVSCCMASIRVMKENNYIPASKDASENYNCPEGFNKNMMKCIDTFRWCEPVKSNSKGGGE